MHADVARFTGETLSALGASLRPVKNGFTALLMVASRRQCALPGTPTLALHADLLVPPREHALLRTDLLVKDLARYVLDAALDPEMTRQPSPARRSGVIRTSGVTARTTLLLARYRFHVTLPGRARDEDDRGRGRAAAGIPSGGRRSGMAALTRTLPHC